MIPIFYRNYPYAPLTTLLSAFSIILAVPAVIGAFYFGTQIPKNPLMLLPCVLSALLAVGLLIVAFGKVLDGLAAKEGEKNIRTKARFAYQYCREHPEAYASLAAENEAFARKYTMNEHGKLVKIKQ